MTFKVVIIKTIDLPYMMICGWMTVNIIYLVGCISIIF